MPRDISKKDDIYVGIVTSHSLAARYLVDSIKANDSMVPVVLGDGINVSASFAPGARVVIVIDLWCLPLPASEYIEALAATIPGCAFVALDRTGNASDVAQFLRAGFVGFSSHDEALCSLAPAIKAVAEGRIWMPRQAMRIYMDLNSRQAVGRARGVETLTAREMQVLELLRRRHSNKEIAAWLGISESTVKYHVSNVLIKLTVKDRRALAENQLGSSRRLWASPGPPDGRVGARSVIAHT